MVSLSRPLHSRTLCGHHPNLLFCASVYLPTLCAHSWICGDTFHFCLEQGNCFNDDNDAIVGSLGMSMIPNFSPWPSALCPFMYPHPWICSNLFLFSLEQGNCFNDNNDVIVGILGLSMIPTFSPWSTTVYFHSSTDSLHSFLDLWRYFSFLLGAR